MSENQFEHKGKIYTALETLGEDFGTCEGCAFDWEDWHDDQQQLCIESPACGFVYRRDGRDIIWRKKLTAPECGE